MKKHKKTIFSMITALGMIATTLSCLSAITASATTTYGDLNDDGNVNLTDLVILNHFLAGQCELSDYDAADVNANYLISSVDSQILNSFLAGYITTLPYTSA